MDRFSYDIFFFQSFPISVCSWNDQTRKWFLQCSMVKYLWVCEKNRCLSSQFFSPQEHFHLLLQPSGFKVQGCCLWTHSVFGKPWFQLAVLESPLPFGSLMAKSTVWPFWPLGFDINKLLPSTHSIRFWSPDQEPDVIGCGWNRFDEGTLLG